MEYPSASPDINPIENLWFVIKKRFYKNGKRAEDLLEAITTVASNVKTMEKLIKSTGQKWLFHYNSL